MKGFEFHRGDSSKQRRGRLKFSVLKTEVKRLW